MESSQILAIRAAKGNAEVIEEPPFSAAKRPNPRLFPTTVPGMPLLSKRLQPPR
jgi:hypothetical protein